MARAGLIAFVAWLGAGAAHGQIELDGSLGAAGVLLPDAANEVRIGEELGARAGQNLFHSFASFDVAADQTASFLGGSDIARVIARVTGGGPSRIAGRLRSEIPDADLYLLNSHGVVFGPGASLDLGGSLYVGAAQALEFAGGDSFSATAPPGVRLSSAPPEAWIFSTPTGAVEVDDARLALDPGSVLSLVGSDVRISADVLDAANPHAQLLAPGGRLELVASGTVSIERALLDASAPGGGLGAGTVSIRARDLSLEDSDIFADNYGSATARATALDFALERDLSLRGSASQITAESFGSAAGGEIRIRAGGKLEILGGAKLVSEANGSGASGDVSVQAAQIAVEGVGSLLSSFVDPRATGPGGDVRVAAQEISVLDGGEISAATLGAGDGGALSVLAGDVRVEGAGADSDGVWTSGIRSDEQAGAVGRAGPLSLEADRVQVLDGGLIGRFSLVRQASPQGDAPGMQLATRELIVSGQRAIQLGSKTVLRPSVVTIATRDRDAGTLSITAAERVVVSAGGQISATTSGRGDAGRIDLISPEIELIGAADADTGILSRSQVLEGDDPLPGGDGGAGGHLNLVTRSLQIRDAARISVSSEQPAPAGQLHVNVPGAAGENAEWRNSARVQLDNGFLLARVNDPSGSVQRGGEIRVHAAQIELGRGSRVSAVNQVTGDAGNVELVADQLVLSDSHVSTEARDGLGGNVAILAGRLVYLLDSSIETSVTLGDGSGGNVSVDPELVVLNRSAIRANADEGFGGNIEIIAGRLVRSADSVIEAESELGIDGEIAIRSPVGDLEGEAARLEAEYVDLSDLLGPACAARARGASLTHVGRARVAPDPDARLEPVAAGEPGAAETCAPAR